MRTAILFVFLLIAIAALEGKRARGFRFRFRLNKKGHARFSARFAHFTKTEVKHHTTHEKHQVTVGGHTHGHETTHVTHTQTSGGGGTGGGLNIIQNYKKEVECSGFCLPDTAFQKGDHCECKAGLAGEGDLCCTDPDEYEYNCVVRGDPFLTSSLGQRATVFNPCGEKLAVIAGRTTDGHQTCQVTVRTADVIENGVFITNQVELTFEIGSGQTEYVFLNGHSFSHSTKSSATLTAQWQGLGEDNQQCVTIQNEKINITYEKCRKIYTVKACGTIINFRRNTEGGKPGVCISSKYGNAVESSGDQCVCNKVTKETYGDFRTQAAFYLAKSFETSEYLNLKLACYKESCKAVTETYNKCDYKRRVKAMNTCTYILQRDFRACAFLFGGIDGRKLFLLFTDCVDAYCRKDQEWCLTMKETCSSLSCNLHDINCCDFSDKPQPSLHPLTQKVISV